jgi:tRNA-dihydrouridine synthase 3
MHVQITEALQEAGVAAVCVHGRTMEQRYKRPADWALIQQVAQDKSVPIIGNGDVLTYYEVRAACEFS